MSKKKKRKYRLAFEFDSQIDMMVFFQRLQVDERAPSRARVRYADSLDRQANVVDHIVGDPERNPGRYIELRADASDGHLGRHFIVEMNADG